LGEKDIWQTQLASYRDFKYTMMDNMMMVNKFMITAVDKVGDTSGM